MKTMTIDDVFAQMESHAFSDNRRGTILTPLMRHVRDMVQYFNSCTLSRETMNEVFGLSDVAYPGQLDTCAAVVEFCAAEHLHCQHHPETPERAETWEFTADTARWAI